MKMNKQEKLFFLVDKINDARSITLTGKPVSIHPTTDLDNQIRSEELQYLFEKLEKDEKVIQVIQESIPHLLNPSTKIPDPYLVEILKGFKEYVIKMHLDPVYRRFAEGIEAGTNLDTGEILTKNSPLCVVKNGIGYLQFGKSGKKKKISRSTARSFRLLQCLLEPLGVAKTIDSVFEAVRLPKDKNDSRLSDWNTEKGRKIELISWTIKELQKGNKLEGKIKVSFNDMKTQVMANYSG